jgi:hypothetical protein
METQKIVGFGILGISAILLVLYILFVRERSREFYNYQLILQNITDSSIPDKVEFKNNRKIKLLLFIIDEMRSKMIKNSNYQLCIKTPESYEDARKNMEKTMIQLINTYKSPSDFTENVYYSFGSVFMVYTYAFYCDGSETQFITTPVVSNGVVDTVTFNYFGKMADVLALSMSTPNMESFRKGIPAQYTSIINGISGPLHTRFFIGPEAVSWINASKTNEQKIDDIKGMIQPMQPSILNTSLIPIIGYIFAVKIVADRSSMTTVPFNDIVNNVVSTCV